MKNKISYKGFTLIEILLVITLIGVLLSIGLVNLNTANKLAEARNDIRKTHIKTLEGAIIQYKLQTGNYPTGLNRNYQEICDPDASSSSCIGFFNLKTFLVPTYLQAIPQDPNDTDNTGGNGYSLAVDVATNTVSIRAIQAEGGVEVKINDPLPAQESVTTNTPLAATVPKLPIVTNGLLLNLDAGDLASYPGTGTTWTDLSGNGNNGTLVNGVGYNSANGGSLVFDGVNDYVAFINSTIGSFNNATFSVGVWFYFDGTSQDNIIISKRNDAPFNQYSMGIGNDAQMGGFGTKLLFFANTDNNIGGYTTFNYQLPSTGWYYGVVVINNNSQKLYVNGVNVLSSTNTYSGQTFNIPGKPLYIGAMNLNNNPSKFFKSRISNVYLYSRALSDSEIQQNFNATRDRFGL